MPWPQTGATQYNVQLGLPDKGRAIKRVGCLQLLESRAFGLGKWSGPRLFSTIPWGMTRSAKIISLQSNGNYKPNNVGNFVIYFDWKVFIKKCTSYEYRNTRTLKNKRELH